MADPLKILLSMLVPGNAVLVLTVGDSSFETPPERDTTPPDAPTGLVGDGSSGVQVSLTWDKNTEPDLDGYRVYRRLDGDTAWTRLTSAGQVLTSAAFIDATIVVETAYEYAVDAIDFSGNVSAKSNIIDITVPDVSNPPPDPVTDLTASAAVAGITLEWTASASPDVDHYVVYVAAAALGPYTELGQTVTTDYFDDSAATGVTTYYRVTAVDLAGNESTAEETSEMRPAPTPTNNIPIIASSGMAPFTVHVNATEYGGSAYFSPNAVVSPGVPLTSGTVLTNRYEWLFLENDAVTPNGAYPSIRGFNAAHRFTAAGTYKVRLMITQENGVIIDRVQTITVAADTRKAIYVDAQSGSDLTGTGTQSTPFRTISAGVNHISAENQKVLVARVNNGAFYDVNGTNTLRFRNTLLEPYTPSGRAGVATRPIFRWNVSKQGRPFFSVTADDVVIQNFCFDVNPRDTALSDTYPMFVQTGQSIKNFTLYNIHAYSGSGIIIQPTINPPNGVLAQDCTSEDRGLSSYGFYCQGANWSIIGCSILNVRSHCIRIAGVDGFLTWANTLRRENRPEPGSTGPRGTITDHGGRYHYHTRNDFSNGFVGLGPLDGGAGLEPAVRDSRLRFVVLERNIHRGVPNISPPGTNGAQGGLQIKHGTENVMVRNNIFTGDSQVAIEVSGYNGQYMRTVNDVWIYNNTAINTGTNGCFLKIWNPTRVRVRNNLYAAAGLADPGTALDERVDMAGFATAGSDAQKPVDRNCWPATVVKSQLSQSKIIRLASSSVNTTVAAWNALAQVGDDIGSNVSFQAGTNKPTSSSAAATAARPVPGVWEDYSGKARMRSEKDWAAGAMES
jgi:hypothetical protein